MENLDPRNGHKFITNYGLKLLKWIENLVMHKLRSFLAISNQPG